MIGKTLAKQFDFNLHVMRVNLDGISHGDSLRRPEQGGNCINWILGHIVATRNGLLALLDERPIWPAERANRYVRGSAPITSGEDAQQLETIRAAFDESQERIMGALLRMPEDRLAAQPEGGEGSMAEKIATLSFHESYHVGQLGLLRRMLGKKGAIQ